jgi:hypothetical protein
VEKSDVKYGQSVIHSSFRDYLFGVSVYLIDWCQLLALGVGVGKVVKLSSEEASSYCKALKEHSDLVFMFMPGCLIGSDALTGLFDSYVCKGTEVKIIYSLM